MNRPIYAGGFLYNPDTDSVLLHLRDGNTLHNPNKWAFFGGLAEDGESPKEAFLREMYEELGVLLTQDVVMDVCNYLNKEKGTHRYIYYAESRLKKFDMILGEGADFGWIPCDSVFDFDITEKTERDLRTWQAQLFS